MSNMVLVSREDYESFQKLRSGRVKALSLVVLLVAFALTCGLVAGRRIWPAPPESLTPAEAAAILVSKNRFAGFSLVSNDAQTVSHSIGCPRCGMPVVDLHVEYQKPREYRNGLLVKALSSPVAMATP